MYSDSQFGGVNDEERRRKRTALQMQIVILESDNRKAIATKNVLDAEMRKMKMDIDRAQVNLEERKRKFDRMTQDISQNEEEIKRIKRQLNLIS